MKSSVLITFLGTGNYQPGRYRIGDFLSDEETYFSAALGACLKPDQIISLETPEARIKHGAQLHDRFSQLDLKHEAISIPNGASEIELWEIFSALTSHVPESCTLHLDITHGFRSLPLLGFLGLTYLRVTRKVTIGGIHYGAWEARDDTNLAPAFNLTPFLTLLDWTAAADQFLSTGSAERLSSLLQDTQQSLWKNPGELSAFQLPRSLKNLATSIDNASLNLLLLRTGSLADSAMKLEKQISIAHADAHAHAQPFIELLNPIRSDLFPHGGSVLPTERH